MTRFLTQRTAKSLSDMVGLRTFKSLASTRFAIRASRLHCVKWVHGSEPKCTQLNTICHNFCHSRKDSFANVRELFASLLTGSVCQVKEWA